MTQALRTHTFMSNTTKADVGVSPEILALELPGSRNIADVITFLTSCKGPFSQLDCACLKPYSVGKAFGTLRRM
jgi:hypothetical protein